MSWQKSRELTMDIDDVVFTNGCFDILHAGHIAYLEKARLLGNFLIVGLNSDESVSRLKGASRPINNERDRADVLSALEAVDAVIIFGEDTPKDLIEFLNPDILVKGSDYDIQDIVGASYVLANGGRVETIDFVHGKSTSRIIERIGNG